MARAHDIETREDCATLVRAFYEQALVDPVIGFLFTDVAHLDLDHHLPRIARFWETVLLGAHTYGGGAFRPHLELNAKVPLRRGHFERWLHLWDATVDAHFSGPTAEEAKAHAHRVAAAFAARLATVSDRETDAGELLGEGPQPLGGLTVLRPSAPADELRRSAPLP